MKEMRIELAHLHYENSLKEKLEAEFNHTVRIIVLLGIYFPLKNIIVSFSNFFFLLLKLDS